MFDPRGLFRLSDEETLQQLAAKPTLSSMFRFWGGFIGVVVGVYLVVYLLAP